MLGTRLIVFCRESVLRTQHWSKWLRRKFTTVCGHPARACKQRKHEEDTCVHWRRSKEVTASLEVLSDKRGDRVQKGKRTEFSQILVLNIKEFAF